MILNPLNKYKIVIKETGEVLDKCRLKGTAIEWEKKWKKLHKVPLEIQEVEDEE